MLLPRFSEEERELIVSLPYRAGLWISRADTRGGTEADRLELAALERVLKENALRVQDSSDLLEIFAGTLDRCDDWANWSGSMDNFLADCGRCMRLLETCVSAKDINRFRMQIFIVGVDVAKAFRERDERDGFFAGLAVTLRKVRDAVVRAVREGQALDLRSIYNISRQEGAALEKLAEALHSGT